MSASQAERREFEPRLPLHFFTMIVVYILFSAKLDRYYTGFSKHPQRRLRQHLRGASAWTSRAEDWVMVYETRLESVAEGRALEKRIKARGARRFVEEQLPNPAGSGTRLNACPAQGGACPAQGGACPAVGGVASSNLVSRSIFLGMKRPSFGRLAWAGHRWQTINS